MSKIQSIEFTAGRPSPGKYYVSIHPDRRDYYGWNMPMMRATIHRESDCIKVELHHGYKPRVDLADVVFDEALWAPRKMPIDPFK